MGRTSPTLLKMRYRFSECLMGLERVCFLFCFVLLLLDGFCCCCLFCFCLFFWGGCWCSGLLTTPAPTTPLTVPMGSTSRGGDVTVYVYDINQPSLPAPFYSVLVSISVSMAFRLYFIPKFSRQLSIFSLCSSGLISALLVLSTICLFMKVSFSPDIIPSG